MSKITLDNLSDNLKAYLEGLGLSEEQVLNLINENGLNEEELKAMLKDTMSINELSTNSKTVIGAINELFQSANNGKELIASAIGEPLNAEDTFSAMSNDINGLLSTFKTNMMNNGITVDSGDKFKALIDKIATMVEEGSGKGIQFAEGTFTITGNKSNYTVNMNLSFSPTYVFANIQNAIYISGAWSNGSVGYVSNLSKFGGDTDPIVMSNVSSESFTISVTSSDIWSNGFANGTYSWYAIGVGEEDTTLRDSLASILEEEGVNVTEEDDMASLITKVDEEFDNKENEIEDTKDKIYDLMVEGGYEVNGSMTMDDLLEILELSGINVDGIKQIAVQASSLYVVKENGSLWVYGENGYGQLGLGSTSNITTFTKVTTNVNNDVKEIITNEFTTFILKNDGSIWACGDNEDGQLGLGNNTTPITKFTKVTTNVNNDVKQIACGGDCTFILKTDGSLWVTGRSQNGQLGLGSGASNKNTFTQVTENINNDVRQIFCRDNSVFIIKNDNTLWACGWNYTGQLGVNSTSFAIYTFTQVTENINNDIRDIYVGDNHTIMVKTDGSLWACGSYNYGCLGLGDDVSSNQTTFTQVTTNVNNDVRLVGCGYYNTFIVKTDGSLWGCGHNEEAFGDNALLSILTNEYLSYQVTTFIKLRKGLVY